MLIGRAQKQFADLIDNHLAYAALMERIIRLVDAPWDAWPLYPDDQPSKPICAGPGRCGPIRLPTPVAS
jgi:hypothetical protein